jgi:VIT1/CCC1 family predicted Fe2+/Mn2+ transporter
MRGRILDPIDRTSEVLFGLVMVLTSTNALSVISAGHADVRTMILGALGCNLAWGIIDGALYLLGCLNERGRNYLMLRSVQTGDDPDAARIAISELLPAALAATFSRSDLEAMRGRMRSLPEPPRPHVTRDEWIGALAVCLLVFLSTFPVVLPFLFTSDVRLALSISNAIAIAMLFACGYAFAQHAGLRPLRSGLLMVAIGCAMVGVAMLLGG